MRCEKPDAVSPVVFLTAGVSPPRVLTAVSGSAFMPVLAGPFCCRGGIFVGTNARGCAWFNVGWPLRPIGYPVKYRPQLSPEAGAVSFRNDGRKLQMLRAPRRRRNAQSAAIPDRSDRGPGPARTKGAAIVVAVVKAGPAGIVQLAIIAVITWGRVDVPGPPVLACVTP
jgi:hypothetical protein